MNKYTHEVLDLTSKLAAALRHRDTLDLEIERLVADLRSEGASWTMVGGALGVSAQAAWEHYGLTPEMKAERSRQNRPTIAQDTLVGLEVTRDDRIASRKRHLDQKRPKSAKDE